MEDLLWTGERLVTSVVEKHGVIEHLHRYALAMELSQNKIVLDIASGEGYGSFLLSKNASKVYGVDIDQKCVDHANKKYFEAKNLKFLYGSANKIPLPDNSVEMVVSFETIEHHKEHDLMMQEILRVLKKEGCLLLSSPDREIYRQREPNNPFHIKELSLVELQLLIRKYFSHSHFFVQRPFIGSLIHSSKNDATSIFKMFYGNYTGISEGLSEDQFYNKPCFNLVVCANTDLTNYKLPYTSVFDGVKVLKKEIQDLKLKRDAALKEKNDILNSKSYIVGNWIVKRLSFLKRNSN